MKILSLSGGLFGFLNLHFLWLFNINLVIQLDKRCFSGVLFIFTNGFCDSLSISLSMPFDQSTLESTCLWVLGTFNIKWLILHSIETTDLMFSHGWTGATSCLNKADHSLATKWIKASIITCLQIGKHKSHISGGISTEWWLGIVPEISNKSLTWFEL